MYWARLNCGKLSFVTYVVHLIFDANVLPSQDSQTGSSWFTGRHLVHFPEWLHLQKTLFLDAAIAVQILLNHHNAAVANHIEFKQSPQF
jgi:hypothetical protein